ncbi:MAG: phosphosulfolactate synthase [Bacteroidota bacterium]
MKNHLPFIPERESKPRNRGLTMMMDKGLSVHEAENFVESSGEYTDLVKFGFGTALISNKLKEKIKIYKEGKIRPYFGGTLFEMFIVRDRFDDFRRMIEKYKLETAEISDGSIHLPHDEKLKYIDILSKQVTVLSEVGSKQKGVEISPDDWVKMMKTELETGAWKVIAEARESGTIGIYNSDGTANMEIINDIIEHVKTDNVLWEAPNKNQQVWFIKLSGTNVNLGNIATQEVIPLEALRRGMRGDTFFDFLPPEFDKFKQ